MHYGGPWWSHGNCLQRQKHEDRDKDRDEDRTRDKDRDKNRDKDRDKDRDIEVENWSTYICLAKVREQNGVRSNKLLGSFGKAVRRDGNSCMKRLLGGLPTDTRGAVKFKALNVRTKNQMKSKIY